jgi:hypothetical protein
VWVSPSKTYSETDVSVILAEMVRNRDMSEQICSYTLDGYPKYADDAVLELVAWVLSLRRASLRDLKNLFVSLRASNGWQIQIVEDTSSTRLRGRVTDEDFQKQICGSRDLSDFEYDLLAARHKGSQGVSTQELASIRRRELQKAYGVIHVSPELVSLDDDGCFRDKFWNLRLLSLQETGTMHIPGILQKDAGDVAQGVQSSVDWENRTRKKRLLVEVLTAARLYEDQGAFSFTNPVSKKTLGKFIESIEANRSDFESLFGLAIRGDLRRAPVIQLREILKLIGLTLTKMSRVRKDLSRTDNYWLDQERWEFVVSTCNLDQHFIQRQALVEQVEMPSSI